MAWYICLAHFAAGLFLANSIPHLVAGISGNRFQSPFAKPPGVGESSPMVNAVWGAVNFVIGYLLLFGIGDFQGGLTLDALIVGGGALLITIFLAWHFGRIRNR